MRATHLARVAHSRTEHCQHVFGQRGEDRRGQQERIGGGGGVRGGDGVVGGVGVAEMLVIVVSIVVVLSRQERRRRVCGIRIHIQIRKRVRDGGARRRRKLNRERWLAVSE